MLQYGGGGGEECVLVKVHTVVCTHVSCVYTTCVKQPVYVWYALVCVLRATGVHDMCVHTYTCVYSRVHSHLI